MISTLIFFNFDRITRRSERERKENRENRRRSQKDGHQTVFRRISHPNPQQRFTRRQQRGKNFNSKNFVKTLFISFSFSSQRPVNPLEYLGKYLLKKANEPPSPEDSKSSTPVPME